MDQLLRAAQVARCLGVSQARLRAWVADGRLPAPVLLPEGLMRWRAREIDGWILSLPRGTTNTKPPVETDLRDLSELAREILQALGEAGGWQSGPDLAARVGGGADSTAGTWKRAIGSLKDAGLVATGARGYRLTDAGSDALQEMAP